ncbi:MAG: hypothetical protein ACP5H2_07790 [Solirubrobacteraceae bacterium]
MSSRMNLDKPLNGGAAKRLGITRSDLPNLGPPWTRRDVVAARRSRPQWLRDAQSRYTAELEAAAGRREQQAVARLDAWGYLGSAERTDAAFIKSDTAYLRLLHAGVGEKTAAFVCAQRWPYWEEYDDDGAEGVW